MSSLNYPQTPAEFYAAVREFHTDSPLAHRAEPLGRIAFGVITEPSERLVVVCETLPGESEDAFGLAVFENDDFTEARIIDMTDTRSAISGPNWATRLAHPHEDLPAGTMTNLATMLRLAKRRYTTQVSPVGLSEYRRRILEIYHGDQPS